MDKIQKQFGKDKIIESVLKSNSFVEVTTYLGLDPKKGHTRKNVERCVKRLKLSVDHFESIRRVKDSKTRWNKERLIYLVNKYNTTNDILKELDILPVTTNYNSLKKHLKKYNIDYTHLSYNKKPIKVNWEDESLIKNVVSESRTQKEVLERLGIRSAGGNFKTLKNYIEKYKIDTSHFTKNYDKMNEINKFKKISLSEILVENSTYNRTRLKNRLYKEGLKERECELCGQDEWWYKKKMSLILDHINGIYNDNRIENLRIVCPNCNSTLSTHCNKKKEYQ